MTKKEKEQDQYARSFQEYFDWWSTRAFIDMIGENNIINIDLTVDDIKRADYIYGKPVPLCKGNMTRQSPTSHEIMAQEPFPHELHDKRIDLYMDIFHFGGCLLFMIESGHIYYVEIYSIISERLESSIIPLVKKEIRTYKARGLHICGVHTDNQFNYETFVDAIKPAILIPYAAN